MKNYTYWDEELGSYMLTLTATGKRLSERDMINIIGDLEHKYDDIDKQEIQKSVVLLDLFTKIYCRYPNDYERFDDLKFRCGECPFEKPNGDCLCKIFKEQYAPDYKDFGCMGDL